MAKPCSLRRAVREAEGLDGLPQSHLVCEDASESVAKEVKEPGHAGLLIGPEDGVEAFVEARGGEGGEIAQGGAPFFPLGGWLEAGIGFQKEILHGGGLKFFHPMAGPGEEEGVGVARDAFLEFRGLFA